MTGDAFILWVEQSALGTLMQREYWVFSVLETIHFIGLSLLLGAIFIVDARVLGFFRGFSIPGASRLIPLAIVGFALNLASGIGFFFSNPSSYYYNPAFRLKMVLILLAGANALYFMFAEHQRVMKLAPNATARPLAKISSALSLFVWFGVILLGRLLPTFEGSTSLFP